MLLATYGILLGLMLPLHIIVLIMVISVYTTGGGERVRLEVSGWMVVGGVVLANFFVALLGGQMCRRAAVRIHEVEKGAGRIMGRLQRGLSILRWATIALLAGQLWMGGWGALVLNPRELGGWGLGDYKVFLLPDLVFLIAPLMTWIFLWAGERQAEVAIFNRGHAYNLALGVPVHYPPTLSQYLILKIRHNFYLFIPMAVARLSDEVGGLYAKEFPWVPAVVSGGTIVILLLILPWLLSRVWSTVAMTGKLRTRLEKSAERHRIRFSNILIWRTHHAVNNAAVVGYLPFARYFMMTDALLESLRDYQIESVFAHELGHAKYKHIWLYLVTILGCLTAAVGLSFFAGLLFHDPPTWMQMGHEDLVGLVQLFLLAGFVIMFFGPVARQFEHEADWFACRHMAEATTRWEMTSSGTIVGMPAGIVGGAEIFSGSLLKIIDLANRDPRVGNWTHPAPAKRTELMMQMALNNSAVEAFEKRRWWTRAWIVSLIVAGGAILAAAIATEMGYGNTGVPKPGEADRRALVDRVDAVYGERSELRGSLEFVGGEKAAARRIQN
jgi:Zn-dependent protease with chaperone function